MNFRIISSIAIAAVSTLMLGSCSADPDSAGFEYMPDMYRSAAIEPYVDYGEIRGRENKDVKMIQSAMTPPAGTIPFFGTDEAEVRLMLPYARKANKSFKSTHGMFNAELTDVDEYALAVSDINGLKLTDENQEAIFKNGKHLYKSKCAHCHGEKGDGNGSMVESGAYAGVPDYANLKELSDGQMFYSIYYGKGQMGAHNSILDKKEIWTIVHQIRKLQNPDYGISGGSESSQTAEVETVSDWDAISIDEMRGHHLKLDIFYNSGSDVIDLSKSSESLESILHFIQVNPDMDILLGGHTDSSGDDLNNLELSKKRAQAVKSWLVSKGCDSNKIETNGYGETQLVFGADGSEDADASRRTELIIK